MDEAARKTLKILEAIAQDGAVSEKFREGLAQLNLRPEQILKLDDALTRLEGLNARQVSVLELRFLGGLGSSEVGRILGISERTVKRDYTFACAWLLKEINNGDDPDASVTLNT